MEIEGKIIAVLDAISGTSKATGNPWKMQEYVIETHDQYPKKMCFRVFGEDKINAMAIRNGEELKVKFDVNAREYNGRWMNDITAWAVERTTAPSAQPASQPMPPKVQTSVQSSLTPNDELPF